MLGNLYIKNEFMEEFTKIINHFLRGEKFKYPFRAKSPDRSYRIYLEKLLAEYIKRIGTLRTVGELTTWLKNNTSNILSVNNLLLSALDEYLSGSAGKAYKKIEDLMKKRFIEEYIIYLKEPLKEYNKQQLNSSSLFRVRCNDNQITKRKEMFHIPFEKRHLVKNQRYSIAGIPCLYLGTSLYVCWQEMGKPDFNKLYLSHFKVNRDNNYGEISVLNFAYSIETLVPGNFEQFFTNKLGGNDRNKMKAFFAFWPILVACSFNAEFYDARFTVEYVIPNLILQWISKEKRPVSGIKYFSTETAKLRNTDIGINYVFPPKAEKYSEGVCEKLQNIFYWSEPVSWQLLEALPFEEYRGFNISSDHDCNGQVKTDTALSTF